MDYDCSNDNTTVTRLFKKDGLLHVTVGYIPTQSSDDSILNISSDTPTKYMDYLFSRQSGSWYLTGLTDSETKPESADSAASAAEPAPLAESEVNDAILATAGDSAADSVAASAETDPKIFAVQSLMLRHFERELADDAGDYVTWMGFACKTGDGRRASRYTKQKRIFSACGGAALYRKSILEEIGTFDENFFAYFEDVDLSWRANNAGYKCVLCPTAKCYHICGASTGAVKYNAFKSQQSGRNSILLPLKNEPLLMLILNFLPLALGYLLKCYKFHKQGFGEAWDKGMHEAFALLKEGRLGKRPFRPKDLPNYILMELWMIWNMVPYLWYRLVVVRFDLK